MGIFVMVKICGIYKITNPKKKVYIGQSTDIADRIRRYKKLHCTRQLKLYYSLKKYGVEKHKFEILHQCNLNQLDELEIYYIKLFQCFNNEYGLNLESGGNGGYKVSEETRRRMSEAQKGHTVSRETRMKIIKANKGRKHTKETRKKLCIARRNQIRKKHSEETKRKIGEAGKGRICSEETRKKISKSSKGRKHTEESKRKISKNNATKRIEVREKISRALKGENNPMYGIHRFGKDNPMYGKKLTENHRKKISKANKGGTRSEETKKKMSEVRKNWWKNKKVKQALERREKYNINV